MEPFDYLAFRETVLETLGPAFALAGFSAALTVSAGSLLSVDRKETLALWLMGAQSETNWARTFNSLFDSLFGSKHLSWNCFLRSSIASLLAAALIWTLMGEFGVLGRRFDAASLPAVLVVALSVNVLADYVSLLESRWLLARLERWRPLPIQVAVLIGDAVVSGVIIVAFMAGYVALLPLLPEGWTPNGLLDESWSVGRTVGVFSVFSVLFYSTFLTSVWCWLYIASTWILRPFVSLRFANWVDVEARPVFFLSLAVAAMTFMIALPADLALRGGEGRVSMADRTICAVFKGDVCNDVRAINPEADADNALLILACEGGAPTECMSKARRVLDMSPEHAFQLFQAACTGGDHIGCDEAGLIALPGGVGLDDEALAGALFDRACQLKGWRDCPNRELHNLAWGDSCPTLISELEHRCEDGDDMACGLRSMRDLTEGFDFTDYNIGASRFPRQVPERDRNRMNHRPCEEGNAGRCRAYARNALCHRSNNEYDPTWAWAKACDLGDREACVWAQSGLVGRLGH